MNSLPHNVQETLAGSWPYPFSFRGPNGCVTGQGEAELVPPGSASTLEARINHALVKMPRRGVIGGALPFDRDQADHLWQAQRLGHDRLFAVAGPRGTGCRVTAEPPVRLYAGAVADALRIMADEKGSAEALEKIVLARTLAVQSDAPILPAAVLAALSLDPSVTAYQVTLPTQPGAGAGCRALVGASPELLLEKTGAQIASWPLAGSARRRPEPVEDADSATRLARSEKDCREHCIVVEYILDTLAPWCSRLSCPEGTGLTCTRSMWHLGTRIEGVLRDASIPSVVLAAKLHPTPAVCGLPHHRAACLIRDLEPVARGFYAGAVGWCESTGDGAWYVTIRCADICGTEARLYAGAGIVPGSDPMAEAAETGAKFGALLAALGLPPDAGLAGIE